MNIVGACYAMSLFVNHTCFENSTKTDCPIGCEVCLNGNIKCRWLYIDSLTLFLMNYLLGFSKRRLGAEMWAYYSCGLLRKMIARKH